MSRRRLAVTVGGALALIALVVVASRGDRPSGGSDGGGKTASLVLVDVVLLVLAIVAAAMVATVLFTFRPTGGAAQPRARTGPKLLGQLMLAIVFAGVIVSFVGLVRWGNGQGRENESATPARNGLEQFEGKQGEKEQVDWLPVVVVFGAALAAFTAAGVVVLRRGPHAEGTASLVHDLSAIFDETLADLHAEADPRRAVIAAYARMESILGRHGMPRRPAEAPHEYVGRVLEDLVSSASAVRRLTRLYERARFSSHDVDRGMKEQAITAVEAVRDEFRAREAERLIAVPH